MSQAFDGVELMTRLDNDWEFLDETVQMLASDGRGLMNEIVGAVSAADAPRVARAGHTLKGMVSNFCAPAAYAAALAVEQIGKSGDIAKATPAVGELNTQLEKLIAELLGFVATRPG